MTEVQLCIFTVDFNNNDSSEHCMYVSRSSVRGYGLTDPDIDVGFVRKSFTVIGSPISEQSEQLLDSNSRRQPQNIHKCVGLSLLLKSTVMHFIKARSSEVNLMVIQFLNVRLPAAGHLRDIIYPIHANITLIEMT